MSSKYLALKLGPLMILLSSLAVESVATELEEVIVTARKRAESLQDAPLAITALRMEDIERFGYRDLESVADQMPELIINVNAAATAGAIALRGVSSGTFGSDLDQAVSRNIDGVVISRAVSLVSGFHDLQQIEVLKGPQALFWGKNSPGGIISFTTADPGEEFEADVTLGHETEMEQAYVSGVLSGPISDNWGARLAVKYLDQEGHMDNEVEGEKWNQLEDIEDTFLRFTLVGDITDKLSVRAKLAYNETDSSGNFGAAQSYYCPTAPAPGDQCKLDDDVRSVGDPRAAGYGPWAEFYADGQPFQDLENTLASVEINYDFGNMTLSALTGWNEWERGFLSIDPISEIPGFISGNGYKYDSISQEIRLSSEHEGPFQFMLGAFWQQVDSDVVGTGYFHDPFVQFTNPGRLIDKSQDTLFWWIGTQSDVATDAWSVFLQGSYDITDTLNLAVGVRYSEEEKEANKFHNTCYAPIVFGSFEPMTEDNCIPFPAPGYQEWDGLEYDADNTSPEVTLTWQPQDNVTYYASYKEGFKSGGFNLTFTITENPIFDEETVEGFEAGIKAELLNRRLRVDWALYSYEYTDLQVSAWDPVTSQIDIFNAAEATVEGTELALTYIPEAVSGLTLTTQIAYNNAEYDEFETRCYVGQTIAGGCTIGPDDMGAFQVQDLSGDKLNYAPEFGATFAAVFEAPLGNTSLSYNLSASANYTDEYMAHDAFNPQAVMTDAWRYNASARLYGADKRWELAVIGRNLSDERRVTYTQEVRGTGFGTGTNDGLSANLSGWGSMPRQIELQATYRF
ncbi:MAG: TonB-dependent receptor [Halieaceae bacterium]|nr:TonB-dependent receptor [Halieaceae bacterium]